VNPCSFAISTGDRYPPRRWFRVRVHATAQELQEAAYKLDPGSGREFWNECEGCCQAVLLGGDKQGYPRNGYAGIVRFASDTFTAEVVAHELVHAAVAVYRMNVCHDVRLGPSVGPREEALAYLYGELFNSLESWLAANEGPAVSPS
jgi:hypothetical protein